MKRFICKLCGESNLRNFDGFFECENCGTKYSIEEAKKLLIDTDDVSNNKTIDDEDKIEINDIPKCFKIDKTDDDIILTAYTSTAKIVTIPNGISVIGPQTFQYKALNEIIIPNSVYKIDSYAFYFSYLKYAVLPNKLRIIGKGAFRNTNLQEIKLPSSLSLIDAEAFAQSSIKDIEIPNGIDKILDKCFFSCRDLKNVKLSNNIKIIGDSAFMDCNNLDELILPPDINKISDNMFTNCISLKNLLIPSNINYIGINSNYNHNNLNIFYDGKIEDWFNIRGEFLKFNNFYIKDVNGNIEFNNNKYKLLNELIIPSNINDININMVKTFKNIEYLITPCIIKDMIDNSNIKNIKITGSNNIPNIGNNNIENIEILNDKANIEFGAFNNCNNLKSITISKINNNYPFGYIFGNIKNKNSIKIKQNYRVNDSVTKEIYYIPSKLKDVKLININKINYGMFYNYINIKTIILSNSIKLIEEDAFYNCNSLIDIYFDGSINDWLNIEFENKYSNPMFYASNFYYLDDNGKFEYNGNKYNKLINLILNDDVTNINKYQFYGYKSLESIYISKNIEYIDNKAFNFNNSLKEIKIDQDNIYFDNKQNINAVINKSKSELILGSANSLIPNYIYVIGPYSFSGNNKIDNIVIPLNVTKIDEGAFYNCYNLKNIIFNGTKRDWKVIIKSDNWNKLDNGKSKIQIICSDGNI